MSMDLMEEKGNGMVTSEKRSDICLKEESHGQRDELRKNQVSVEIVE
ncbi:hypothetical protein COLO4_07937 [Corchorus olitorius]|uniref:Uncharacterized protein n=1 Tax=Corchorus olitorius TaxID=93759 RepID=A0A1R3KI48_9ROSI|nr:hypothetical protein COLO4_07937 [Corchorus olitorius]